MDDLLDFVLEVHGALRRWPGVSALHRKARRRLAVLEEQRIPRLFGDRAVDICTRRQHAVLTPSSPTYPGVRGPRDQPVEGRWPAWGRPHATVPAVIATHTGEQVFYFGEDGLLRRRDYTVDVGAGALAAHYAGGYKTFGELASPIRHLLYRRSPDAPEASLRCIPSCPDRARPSYQETHREAPSPLQPPAVGDGILAAVKDEEG
jgi:hypothetical protein